MASGARQSGEATTREREMRRIVAQGERDGLTVRDAAWRAGMPTGTLAWWRGEIRRRDALRAVREEKPVFIEVVAMDERAAEPKAQVGGSGSGADGRPPDGGEIGDKPASDDDDGAPHVLEVELRCGRRLRVAASYGLARLVREIEEC